MTWFTDALERTIRTFIAAFASALVAGAANVHDWNTAKSAIVAAVLAAVTAAMAGLAALRPGTVTPASVVRAEVTSGE